MPGVPCGNTAAVIQGGTGVIDVADVPRSVDSSTGARIAGESR